MDLNLEDLQNIIDSTAESDVFKKISRDKFFDILTKSEIDLQQLAAKRKKHDFEPFHRFNFILKELHEETLIDIADSCIYLETEMLTVKDIIGCLNEENLYTLRVSLAKRNGIKLKGNKLKRFLK